MTWGGGDPEPLVDSTLVATSNRVERTAVGAKVP